MTENKKHMRKRLIVNPVLQKRIIKDVTFIPLVSVIIASLVVAVAFIYMLRMLDTSGVQVPGVYTFMISLGALVFVSSCCITLKMATHISNRVAGPLYRLNRTMEDVIQGGTCERIKFRKNDYLHETAESFNRLLDYIDMLRNDEKPVQEPLPKEASEKDALESVH